MIDRSELNVMLKPQHDFKAQRYLKQPRNTPLVETHRRKKTCKIVWTTFAANYRPV